MMGILVAWEGTKTRPQKFLVQEEEGKMQDETGWQDLPVELQTIILSFLPVKV